MPTLKPKEPDADRAIHTLADTLLSLPSRAEAGEIARRLDAILRSLHPSMAPAPHGASSLSAQERLALTEAGVAEPSQDALHASTKTGMISAYTLGLTALTVTEVADMLGVDPSRVRQRIREGSLLALAPLHGRAWRIPAFQFTEGAELPGLASVLRALPNDIRVESVEGFFTTPQPDLIDKGGDARTPRDWLLHGGDPGAVIALARHL